MEGHGIDRSDFILEREIAAALSKISASTPVF
jgi:hypothetical protein